MSKKTICAQCRYCRGWPEVWDNWVCTGKRACQGGSAPISYLTGQELVDKDLPLCREINNDGKCLFYKNTPWWNRWLP